MIIINRRIFCITPNGIYTQRDDEGLLVTNTYSFVGDADIDSISIGRSDDEIIINARADKKVITATK